MRVHGLHAFCPCGIGILTRTGAAAPCVCPRGRHTLPAWEAYSTRTGASDPSVCPCGKHILPVRAHGIHLFAHAGGIFYPYGRIASICLPVRKAYSPGIDASDPFVCPYGMQFLPVRAHLRDFRETRCDIPSFIYSSSYVRHNSKLVIRSSRRAEIGRMCSMNRVP